MIEATLTGTAEMTFSPVVQSAQPASNVAQLIAVLSGRNVQDVRAHFHRDGGRWKLRGTDLTCHDGELCSLVEWFAASKVGQWND
ncbi:MAG: hypothetical protein ABJP79_00725 [Tateyamaria sp.]|uniref:hypothetical protein n=1 Tax=Tateyamaria sp. TaxID=1929288 RepID=UPI00329D8D4D